MNTYSGTELNEKINAFRLKKGLKDPNVFDSSSTVRLDYTPTLLSRAVTALEKMDSLWVRYIRN